MANRKECIERVALIDKLDRRVNQLRKKHGSFDPYTDGFDEAVDIVSDAPAADVVEVVRCSQCKHITPVEGGLPLCTLHNTAVAYNDFCSHGERKGTS